MRSLDCKERVEAYFHNMAKYEKDIYIPDEDGGCEYSRNSYPCALS